MARHLGIDLGTSNTRFWLKEKGILLRSPSAVAIDNKTREVVAVGSDARRMVGKTPVHLSAYRPVQDSVVTNLEVTSTMLHEFFVRTNCTGFFNKPVVLAASPYRLTDVERLAIETAILDAGAKSVAMIDAPLAAALGSGLRIADPRGCMICDIGGGTTEIAVISSGGIVRAKSLRVGGDKFDQAIINYCKYRKDLIVGDTAAEMAKRQLAVATPNMDRGSMQIFGRNVRTGLATTQTLASGEVCQALRAPIEAIIRAIITTIEETPPEIAGDIFDFGIMLTGGGANIPGLAAHISGQVGIRVTIAKHPTDAVCQGLGRFIEHPKLTSKQLIYRSR